MLVRSYKDVDTIHTTEGTEKRVVIGPKEGAPTFVMRVIDLPPGSSYFHSHDWEHEVFVLAGGAVLVSEQREMPLKADDVIYIAPFEKHGLTSSYS